MSINPVQNGKQLLVDANGNLFVTFAGTTQAVQLVDAAGVNKASISAAGALSAQIAANTKTTPLFVNPSDSTNGLQAAISVLGTLPTGTNIMTVHSVALPTIVAGAATSINFLNNSGAAISVKGSAGNLYGFSITNETAAVAYIEFFNTSGVPSLGVTAVLFAIKLPASANITMPVSDIPIANFTTGIGFAVTTTENGASTAAVTGIVNFK